MIDVEAFNHYFRTALRDKLLESSPLESLSVMPLGVILNGGERIYSWKFRGQLSGELIAKEVEAEVRYSPQTKRFDVYASDDKKGLEFDVVKNELLDYFKC
jgi:hypothetical protein